MAINPPFSIQFPPAYSSLSLSGKFRHLPEDFYVEELLGFPLSGDGEHLCLFVEKQSHNTHWVKAALAEYSGIAEKDISSCGRKDRHAVTRQWFSFYDPQRLAIDWGAFSMEGVRILEIKRHHKKLRLGDHQQNYFVIRLRDVKHSNDDAEINDDLQQEYLQHIVQRLTAGVPNYYGSQRFGREANNLSMAHDWLVNGQAPLRSQRSIVLSAARSYLFNQVLAYRVLHNHWRECLDGDVEESSFPTGPLWGRGRLSTQGQALAIETSVLEPYSVWCHRLEHLGLHQERRALVLFPQSLSVKWDKQDLVLSFSLPSGTFATSVLAEVAQLQHA